MRKAFVVWCVTLIIALASTFVAFITWLAKSHGSTGQIALYWLIISGGTLVVATCVFCYLAFTGNVYRTSDRSECETTSLQSDSIDSNRST